MGCADFWEMILLARKVLIMASFLFFADLAEQAWFLGSTVMVASLLLHAAAKPYEDALIDWCEFLSLVSTLFIFQSGVVFKVLNDPANPATGDEGRALASALEGISIVLMGGNVVLVLIIQARVVCHVQTGDEDYRVRLIQQQIDDQEKGVELAKKWLDKAKAKAKARAKAKDQAGGETTTVANPLGDDDSDDGDSDDESGEKKRGKKKGGKAKGKKKG